jgi:hypothetical protein
MAIIRFGSGYGSGRNNTPYTTLKIALVTPMPREGQAEDDHGGET